MFRQELKEDTEEYMFLTSEELKQFGTGYFMNLDAETELPSDEPEEIWDQVYTSGKRTDLLNNAEFNIYRDILYDTLLLRAAKDAKKAFVHGSGIGHEVMILARQGIEVYYYEPDEKKKEFQRWRENGRIDGTRRPVPIDVTRWRTPWNLELDLVVSFDVLEHLHAPFRTISKLGELVHEEGLLLLMPAFQWPKHKQHLEEWDWVSGFYFVKVMKGLGFKVKWQQGNFFMFQPIFHNRHPVWKL